MEKYESVGKSIDVRFVQSRKQSYLDQCVHFRNGILYYTLSLASSLASIFVYLLYFIMLLSLVYRYQHSDLRLHKIVLRFYVKCGPTAVVVAAVGRIVGVAVRSWTARAIAEVTATTISTVEGVVRLTCPFI